MNHASLYAQDDLKAVEKGLSKVTKLDEDDARPEDDAIRALVAR
jgi:hypothetical protein